MPPSLDSRGLPTGAALRPDELSPRDFANLMKSAPKSTILIDVRTQPEWDTARVDGAILLPLDRFEQGLEQLDLEGAQTVGLLCHHGVRSLKAADLLRAHGITTGKSIFGGIELWSQSVDAAIPRYTRDRATNKCTIVQPVR